MGAWCIHVQCTHTHTHTHTHILLSSQMQGDMKLSHHCRGPQHRNGTESVNDQGTHRQIVVKGVLSRPNTWDEPDINVALLLSDVRGGLPQVKGVRTDIEPSILTTTYLFNVTFESSKCERGSKHVCTYYYVCVLSGPILTILSLTLLLVVLVISLDSGNNRLLKEKLCLVLRATGHQGLFRISSAL
jgi:hypothetical protein